MYSTPDHAQTVKHCLTCGAAFESQARTRKYCSACVAKQGRKMSIRQCSICGASVQVIVGGSSKAETSTTRRTICATCRVAMSQRTCKECGRPVGKRQQLCQDCRKQKRTIASALSELRSRTGTCKHCGGPCRKDARYCKACCLTKGARKTKFADRTCLVCGGVFTPHTKSQKCCGKTCQETYTGDQHRERTVRLNIYVCKYCGETYKAKKKERDQYCCREHADLDVGEFACVACGQKVRGFKNLIAGRFCSEECRSKSYERTCDACGCVFTSISPFAHYCYECSKQRKCLRMREAEKAKFEAEVKPRACKNCGNSFTPEYRTWRRVFCSKQCQKSYGQRVGKAARRARLRMVEVEHIDPLAVLRRDKWTCHICGRKTPKLLRGTTNPLAPEVDHIIPIALGGGHTWDNVACACRQCNIKKGASLFGQLPLLE